MIFKYCPFSDVVAKVIILIILLISPFQILFAQLVRLSGKVSDLSNSEPVPYATVSVKGTAFGVYTDFEGNYILEFENANPDSLLVSSMGFEAQTRALGTDSLGRLLAEQHIDIQLNPGSLTLAEVVVHGGENPAWRIIRKAEENRKKNNYNELNSYNYNTYNKIEADINKISDKLSGKKVFQKVEKASDKVGELIDENGNKLLPLFISESYSHYYFRNNPKLSKENILKTQVKGIAITDGSLTSQLIGSTFQQYNFYDNQLNILNKNVSSPIGNDWRWVYDYYLSDSLHLGEDFCYRIEFEPKRKQDLAFSGVMWITKDDFALVMIDATIGKEANLNYIDRIKIQQDLELVEEVYFPVKNRIVIDVSEITDNTSGLLLKFVNYNENIRLNDVKDVSFFRNTISLAEDFKDTDVAYWQKTRPEQLDMNDQMAYAMIDSMKQVPTIKFVSALINIASTGYMKFLPGIDLGPLVYSGAINDVEGLRMRLGLRTNIDFSKKWVLKGYAAYGTKDNKWKGGGEVTRIFSKAPWSTLKLGYKQDIEQVGFKEEDVGLGTLFSAAIKFGRLLRPYNEQEMKVEFERELSKGIVASIGFRVRDFNPLYPFEYRNRSQLPDMSTLVNTFSTSEVVGQITMARDQLTVINDNERLDLGTIHSPTVFLRYVLGVKKVFNSDFNYHKLSVRYKHSLNLGYLGKTYYRAEAGKIWGTLPYPLLKNHLGNETPLAITSGFNLMHYYEFISDQYFMARFHQDFEGLLFNRLPLIKKLKWRTFATGKILFGSLSGENMALTNGALNQDFATFKGLNPAKPYIEMGYGVSNIFKFFRVEAIHRLTYLESSHVRKFGVKFAAEITI